MSLILDKRVLFFFKEWQQFRKQGYFFRHFHWKRVIFLVLQVFLNKKGSFFSAVNISERGDFLIFRTIILLHANDRTRHLPQCRIQIRAFNRIGKRHETTGHFATINYQLVSHYQNTTCLFPSSLQPSDLQCVTLPVVLKLWPERVPRESGTFVQKSSAPCGTVHFYCVPKCPYKAQKVYNKSSYGCDKPIR